MNFKTTVMLIVLLVLLGGFVLLTRDRSPNYEHEQQRMREAASGQQLFTAEQLVIDRVKSIRIEQGGYSAVIGKVDGQWQQVEPVAFPLSQESVLTLLDTLAQMRFAEAFEPGKGEYPAADKLGLSPAETVVTLEMEDRALKVSLGRTLIGRQMYVQTGDSGRAYVVPDTLAGFVGDRPWERWRVRSLVVPLERQVSGVTIRKVQAQAVGDAIETISVERQDNAWRMTLPENDRADAQRVASVLSQLATTTIESFVADGPADLSVYGLDEPWVEVEVTSHEASRQAASVKGGDASAAPASQMAQERYVLRIGRPAALDGSSRHAVWMKQGQRPVVVTIGREAAERLASIDADALRDRRLVSLASGRVRGLELAHGGQVIALTRGAEGWTFDDASASGYQSDDGVVAALVDRLVRTQASRFVPAATVEGNEPMAVVRLTALARSEPWVLRFWQVNEKDEQGRPQWLARLDDEPAGRVFVADELREVLKPRWYFRERDVATVDVGRVDGVEIHRRGQTVRLTRTLAGDDAGQDRAGAWRKTGEASPEGMADDVNQALLGRMLQSLSPLRATQWLDPAQPFELSEKELYKLVLYEGNEKKLELHMSQEGQAKLAGDEQWFMLPAELRDTILSPSDARTVLGLGHREIRQIDIQQPQRRVLTLVRNSAGVFQAQHPAAGTQWKLDAARFARQVDALVGLLGRTLAGEPAVSELTLVAKYQVTDEQQRVRTLAVYHDKEGKLLAQQAEQWYEVHGPAAANLVETLPEPARLEPGAKMPQR